jgi:hypothetical protein
MRRCSFFLGLHRSGQSGFSPRGPGGGRILEKNNALPGPSQEWAGRFPYRYIEEGVSVFFPPQYGALCFLRCEVVFHSDTNR